MKIIAVSTMLLPRLIIQVGCIIPPTVSATSFPIDYDEQKIISQAAHSSFSCDLPSILDPSSDGLPSASDIFDTEKALLKQVERHGTLVKIPTISYDDNGEPNDDPRWVVFYEFHAALIKLFPFVHARMERLTVNTFGLVYTVEGQDPSLKPIMLTAHQDVVPVPDATLWTYPPFSAHFDGRWLWGRGAADDKSSLTGIFSALEALLSDPLWNPKRTIIVALGFDEESGSRGAGTIGQYLEEKYGQWSMAMVLDEGGMGLELLENRTLYALPAVTEKGNVNVWLDLTVNGGHSSMPFPHTGIGIMSEIVVELEAHQYEPKLIKGSPIYNHLVCQARYSPDAAPEITKFIQADKLDDLAKKLSAADRATQYRIQTSQAIDFFNAGVKINAMPEKVQVGINHRIAPHDSAEVVKSKILDAVKVIAKKYNLTIKAYGRNNEDSENITPAYETDYNGTLTLTAAPHGEQAPVSPTDGAVWDVFSGTIQHTFAFGDGKVVPVGELMTGNTDTRYYLNLTKNIYRWAPIRDGGKANGHTVDEGIDMYAHVEGVKFYYDLIRNFDQSDA